MTLSVLGIAPQLVASSDGTLDRIRAALPVMGHGQWYEMAQAVNWLGGVGGAIACAGVNSSLITAGNSALSLFYVWPRSQHSTWLWVVELKASLTDGARGTVTLEPGGDEFEFSLTNDQAQRFHFLQDPSSVAEGEASVEVAANADSPSSVRVQAITVSEVKRRFLSPTSGEVGVYASSCEKGNAIYENTTTLDKYSAQGVWEQVRDAKGNARRQMLLNVYDPDGITITTTAFPGSSNVFAIDPAVQCRNTTAGGSTTRNCEWNVMASQNGGGSSEVRLTMTTGAVSTITVTSTSATWHTAHNFAIETDDLSVSNTIRGGTRDSVRVEARRISGTSVTVYGVAIGEDQ